MSHLIFITDSFIRLVSITVRWFVFMIVLTTGVVSCSHQQNITSASIRNISHEKFTYIDWSPDNSTLFAVGSPYNVTAFTDLYSFELTSGRFIELTEHSGVFDFPRWSPDGENVVITVDQNTIWIFDIVSRRFTYLTDGEGAIWLPDGEKLAVYVGWLSNKGTDHREIRIIDLQGNILRRIDVGAVIPELLQLQPYHVTPIEYLAGIDVSPDGAHVIFSLYLYKGRLEGDESGDQSQEAYIVNLHDEDVYPFLPNESVGFVSWSPDGNKIAYIRPKILGIGKLMIVDTQGNCQMVPDLSTEIETPSWSNNGSEIAFLYEGEIHILDINLYLELEGSGCP